MEALLALALSGIEDALPLLATALPSQLTGTINFLEGLIPQLSTLAPEVISSVQGIISALQPNATLTPAQVQQLTNTAVALETALDAQATVDGLGGVPQAGS